MKKVVEHGDTILQVKVPVPFPLKWVNSYVLKGRRGYTIIDPGLHTEDAEMFWRQVLMDQGIQFNEIEQIVLTHHHPDHYGLAGWFQMHSSAPVYMSETSYRQAMQLWGPDQSVNRKIVELFQRHGMDQETINQMIPHLESFVPLVSPQPKVDFIYPDQQFTIGDRSYVMIEASGHATGQLCFYDAIDEKIFCGDQVIPRITPNVSLIPDGDANPLETFLTSLKKLGNIPVTLAFPGHGNPFTTFNERTQQIIDHHHDRLEKMIEQLGQPLTAFDLCISLFGHKLSIHQLRFAMSETLAHLIYLREQGKVSEIENEEQKRTYFVAH